jgi:uncharacterized membrane protein (DUF441 family)
MYEKIKPILAALFGSKKFIALLAGILVWLAGKSGLALTSADVTPVLYLIGTYIGGQALADIGKEKAKVEGQTMEKLAAADPKPQA